MHLGNVFCALIAWLSARANGGRFLLRIEDLDTARCPKANADEILRDLAWLGLTWDGEIWYQSERADVYAQYLAVLAERQTVYPCFCSRAELHAAEAPHLSDGTPVYTGTCRALTPAQVAVFTQAGRRPSLRVQVPDRVIKFHDGLCGEAAQNLATDCGDFVVRRSDGVHAYQLAVVIDDALSGVTEVVRGEDLLYSTPRQIWLGQTLGFTEPHYYHVPLLTDADGRRLSKRDGDTLAHVKEHYTAREIVGALAYAAGLLDTPQPISPQELIGIFDWGKIKRTPKLPEMFLSF